MFALLVLVMEKKWDNFIIKFLHSKLCYKLTNSNCSVYCFAVSWGGQSQCATFLVVNIEGRKNEAFLESISSSKYFPFLVTLCDT